VYFSSLPNVDYGRYGHGGAPMGLILQQAMPFAHAKRGDGFCSPIHEDGTAS